jgi:streptogramin lyase
MWLRAIALANGPEPETVTSSESPRASGSARAVLGLRTFELEMPVDENEDQQGRVPYGVVKDSHDNVWISEFHGSYPAPQRTDMPMTRVASDGAVWYAPRSAKNAGVGVMYPDMTKMTTFAGYGSND